MAKNTNKNLRNQVIYSIYVRNHTEEGTFQAVEKDLNRIQELGTDIIWFMPIHPIGIKGKKGSLGCPYAIRNYRETNPEYGTMEEFKHLVDEIHKKGMKCIIDVVYNHTSPDSWLVENHREFFYKKKDGSLGNHVGDWTDVVDLDYQNKDLWTYLIDTLKMWAQIVDGFRCDVASLLPIEFWMKARAEVETVHPGCIWLAESIEGSFIKYLRDTGLIANSDSEVYNAFDIEYEYDVWGKFLDYVNGKAPLSRWVEELNMQEYIYPENYIKLRCLENHDQERIKKRVKDETRLINLTAFTYFQKGTTLVYAGQEFENDHLPSLFEKEVISYNTGFDLSELMKKLYTIIKQDIFCDGNYNLTADDTNDIVVGQYIMNNKDHDNSQNEMKEQWIGIFSLGEGSTTDCIPENVPDGKYLNLINDETIEIKNRRLDTCRKPVIFKITK